jgi:hypothetical protein
MAPSRCGRVWIHTHPGTSPHPSFTDENTFERVFGTCDWALMAIVARNGSTYGRQRFNAGPGGETMIPITVDWERYPRDLLELEGKMDARFIDWMDEYGTHIHHTPALNLMLKKTMAPWERPPAYLDQLNQLDELYDQQMLMDDFSPSFNESEIEASAQEMYPCA